MIRAGQYILFNLCCPSCGKPTGLQHANSRFFVICCQEQECLVRGANIVVERTTGHVLSNDAQFMYVDGENKRVYPALLDNDGKQVWPKGESFRFEESGSLKPGDVIELDLVKGTARVRID